MHKLLRNIEEALQQIHHIDLSLRVEHFLVEAVPSGTTQKAASHSSMPGEELSGSLLVLQEEDPEEVSLGVYLSKSVRETLSGMSLHPETWSLQQTRAFAIAVEEISHFHYFVFHTPSRKALSQLELEVQGEIDKFLLFYFSKANAQLEEPLFETVYEQLFTNFTIPNSLEKHLRQRYEEANRLAKSIVATQKPHFKANRLTSLLKSMRRCYRCQLSEKPHSLS